MIFPRNCVAYTAVVVRAWTARNEAEKMRTGKVLKAHQRKLELATERYDKAIEERNGRFGQ